MLCVEYCGLSSLLARYIDALVSSIFFCFGDPFRKSDYMCHQTTKQATTRDYVDRNIPDVFDVVCDTNGRGGFSVKDCHSLLPAKQVCSNSQESIFVP